MFGLNHLVAPLSADDFLGNFWGKRAVYIQGREGKFKDLFGWQDVHAYLNNARDNYSGFRLVHEKTALGPQAFRELDGWLKKGATLVINSVQQIDEVLRRFNHMLGADLNTAINTNCYVSCPAKQAFDNHFDEHCVFVVQTEGRKAWKVFQPTIKFPLHAQRLVHKDKPPETDPYLECVLSPGDVLFIPRGHWHYAVAETPSVHLTVGPQSRSAAEFLGWLHMQLMNNEEFFRRDFPVAGARALGGTIDGALEAHVAEFRHRMTEVIQGDALMEALIQYCMSANPVKRNRRLPHDWMIDQRISPETAFELPAEQKTLIRYDPDTRSAAIHVRGHLLRLSGLPEVLVAPMFERPGVAMTGAGLLARCPELGWDKMKAILLNLHSTGVLELSELDTTVMASSLDVR
jgi:ribosomal protein L16 Arg81 hydroxylase